MAGCLQRVGGEDLQVPQRACGCAWHTTPLAVISAGSAVTVNAGSRWACSRMMLTSLACSCAVSHSPENGFRAGLRKDALGSESQTDPVPVEDDVLQCVIVGRVPQQVGADSR